MLFPTFSKFRSTLNLLLAFLLTSGWLHAAPYFGEEAFTYRQPDGEAFQVHLYGDEFFAYEETADGYLVIRDPNNGLFCYAKVTPDGSDIISTGVRVGKAKPAGLNPKQRLASGKAMEKSLRNRNLLGVDDKGRRNHGKKLFKSKNGGIINVEVAEAPPQPSVGVEPAPEASAEPPPDSPPAAPAPPPAVTINQRVGLVLLASFPDRPADITKTVSQVDDYCNAESYTADGNATSIYGYFKMQSNGKLSYKNNVTAWFTAANPRSYYTDNTVAYATRARELIKEGLTALKAQGFDFTQCDGDNNGKLDGVNCFYAGARTNAWSEGIWPHQSSSSWTGLTGTGLTTTSYDYQITDMPASLPIGTFCHENGHMICDFPDLYSYDGNAANIGTFSLMASSGSTHPRHVDPYLKIHAGWADVVDITSTSHLLCAVQQDRNFFYRYRNPAKTTEYFIFEVRGTAGYEGVWNGAAATNPANGLVIYHANQTGTNTSSSIVTRANPPTTTLSYTTPYELMVVEATPTVLANGDPWYTDPTPSSNDSFSSTGVSSISDITTPNLKFWAADGRTLASGANIHTISAAGATMSFVAGAGALPATPATNVTATQFQPNVDFGENAANQTFSVFNGGGGTLTYTVSGNAAWLACAPASGTATTEADLITVSYTTSALAVGSHSGTITIDGGAAGIKTIGVTLTVNPRPTLAATPVSLAVAGITGTSGPNATFNISNSGGGTVSYTISKTQAWLTLDRTSGSLASEQDLVKATLNATSLAPGVYTDTITITAAEATNSPLTIPVSYTVGSTDMILTSPNGGETWYINNTKAITWASSLGGTVKIELFKAGGLHTTIAASAPNTGTYSWTLPGTLPLASDYKIKITINPNGASDESFSNFSIAEDLLALALDTPSLTWSTSTPAWFRTTTVTNTHDGVDAAESANITHGEATTMETTIVGPGTMTFWWKVSSEGGYDFLLFYLNGVEQTGSLAKISGTTTSWVQKTVTIPAGSNVVKWGYSKDGSVDGGTDTAWVDQVVFTPDAQPEIAVEDNGSAGLTDGSSTDNFGSVSTTGGTVARTFTIRNLGTADLTISALNKSGVNSADYTLGGFTPTTLVQNAFTTFTVTFDPSADGVRTAAIQIASDDANENPFDINLTGTGIGPGTLVVTGAGGLTSSGTYAGPFTPSSIDYTLSNPGSTSITWAAAKTQSWVTLSSTGGTLAAGATTTVTASINTGATTLVVGTYNDTISFTSSTTGNTTRPVALTVNPIAVTVSLSNLLQLYDGSPKPVTVTTNPTPRAYAVTYNGSSTVPTTGGTYAVVATVTEPNHAGSASGNLVIAYNVTYLSNGNTGGAVPADQTKFHNVDLTLAANSGNLNKTDYSFAGWNTAFDGSGTPYAGGATYSGNASLTLYAQWVPGADGTWIQTIAGPFNWGDSANWSAGTVAAGADRTAYFTPNITAAQVVNLESARTIGNITFTDSTSASNNLTISGANTLTLARTSGAPTINVTNNALTISSVIAGSNGILKTGAGTLTLSSVSANIFTGGFEINGGMIATSADANFGGVGGITVSGTSTWSAGPSVTTYNRALSIGTGASLTLTSGNTGKTITGILSGSGSLINSSTTGFDFNNTGNTFTGAVSNGYQMSFASLGDSSNPINLIGSNSNFIWAGGAKTFALRPLTLNATGTGKFNNNGSGAVVIQQNLAISGTAGARTLSLGGSYTAGANRFSGNIADGTGSVVGLTVTGNATWALSGTNTYSGATSIGNGSPNSTLVIQGLQALSGSTTITMTQTSTPASTLKLLDDGAGVLTKPNTLITAFNNAVMNGLIFVGNNSVANGGTSAGTTTGSTIALGTLRLGNNITAQGFREIQGANGYKLQFNNVELSAGGALTTYSPIFNPTSAAVILAGTIQQLAGNTATTTAVTLNLAGTNSSNSVTGIINDAVDFGTNVNARSLNVLKSSTSTWTLSGVNTYTGTTTVSAGSLFINGDQSLATGDVSVASGATLGGAGTIGGNATIATGGKLEFNISTSTGSHNPLDLVAGKGLAFSGTSTLTITSLAGASPGIYTLITGGNNIGGIAPATVNLPSGWVATVSISGNSLLLNVTSIGGATAGSLAVTAAGGLSSSGFVGGPFSPNSVVYTLSNPGQTDISWTAGKTAAWTTLSAAGGTLVAGTNTTVTVSINASANSLGAGSYSDTVTFTNTTNATGNTTRAVSLTVNALPTYTVSYNGNGNTGGSAPTSQTKTQDIGLTLSNQGTLVRAGYTFTGWDTAADGTGDGYAAGATYNTNASATLYAQWTPSMYTVTFNANGGVAPNPATTLVTYGSTYGPLATVTRSGYTFTGWFTLATGGSQVTDATTVTITGAQTLYAQWTVNPYTITFDSAGGSAVASITQNFGTSVTPPAAPTRANYTFASWNPAVPATMPANDLTVTAQWTANTYIVTFDPNGGDVPSPTSKPVAYASTYGPLATVARTGHSSNGWFTLPSGGTQVTDATTVAITGPQTLYAQWTINTYAVTYNANSANSGAVPANQTKNYGVSLPLQANTGSLARIGYTFAGWNTAADGTGTSYTESASYTANAAVTLYAKWTANTYTVSFNANGGQAPVPASKVVTFDTVYGTLAATSRAAHLFNGWFTALTGGSQVTSETFVATAADHTLHARWTPIFPEMDVTRLAAVDVGSYEQVSGITANVDTKLTYEISNSGSGPLTLANAVISATNNCTITVDNQPASSLAPLGSSNLIINLKPAAEGAWSFRVSIANNDPDENPYQWTVHGVAQTSTTISVVASADTYIYKKNPADSKNFSTETAIQLNSEGSYTKQGLIQFTLPVVTNANVTAASLNFFTAGGQPGSVQILNTSGTPAPATATWNDSSAKIGTTVYGTESITTATLGTAVPSIGLDSVGAALVQGWLRGGANNGFSIKTNYSNKSANNHVMVCSANYPTTTNDYRPKLNVTYTTSPQVAEIDITRAGSAVTDGGTDAVSSTTVGSGTQLTYTIANLGNVDLALTASISVTGAANCTVQVNAQPASTVVPSSDTPLVLTVTPTLAGVWSAVLSITNNDLNEAPYNWTISGTAAGGYTAWVNGTFTNGNTLSNKNMDFDSDGDGLPSGLEWVLGGDPTLASDAAIKKPVFDNTDPEYFIYSYRRSNLANSDPKTSIVVEYGSDLNGWTSADHDGSNVIILTTPDGYEPGVDKMDVKIKRSTKAPSGKIFTRLKVVIAP